MSQLLRPDILASTLDDDMCEPILKEMNENINIFTNHLAIKAEEKEGKIKGVVIQDKETNEEKQLKTDVLVIAMYW